MLAGLKNVSSANDDEGAAVLTASAQQGSFATPESARTAHTTTTHTHKQFDSRSRFLGIFVSSLQDRVPTSKTRGIREKSTAILQLK